MEQRPTKAVEAALLRPLDVEAMVVLRDGIHDFAVLVWSERSGQAPRRAPPEKVQAEAFRMMKQSRPDYLLIQAERFSKE